MIVILTIIIFFIVKNSYYELYTNESDIKYVLTQRDKNYINKHGKPLNSVPKNTNGFFYTNTTWNPENYLNLNNKYYMVEPGYYYKVSPDTIYNTGKIKILFVEKNKKQIKDV